VEQGCQHEQRAVGAPIRPLPVQVLLQRLAHFIKSDGDHASLDAGGKIVIVPGSDDVKDHVQPFDSVQCVVPYIRLMGRSLVDSGHGGHFRDDLTEQAEMVERSQSSGRLFPPQNLEELVADALRRDICQPGGTCLQACQRRWINPQVISHTGAHGAQAAHGITEDRLGAALA